MQRLGLAMAGLADVPRERVTDVLGQLLVAVQSKTPIGIGTNDYLRKVMTDSLGERRAGALLGRIVKGRESTGIDALKWMEPRAVAEIVEREHPQIVATILAHLPSQQAADVLKELDAATQADIAMRMARLDEVPETALQELDGIVERQTKEATAVKTAKLGGVKAAADMINLLGYRPRDDDRGDPGRRRGARRADQGRAVRVRQPARHRRPRHAGDPARSPSRLVWPSP